MSFLNESKCLWVIRSYAPPNRGGGLLLETWHTTDASKDVELAAYRERMRAGEVSRVEVVDRTRHRTVELFP